MGVFGNLKQEVACEKQVNVFLRKRKALRVSGGLLYLESYTTERLPKNTTNNTTGNITTKNITQTMVTPS